jgi:hypothetical protein
MAGNDPFSLPDAAFDEPLGNELRTGLLRALSSSKGSAESERSGGEGDKETGPCTGQFVR